MTTIEFYNRIGQDYAEVLDRMTGSEAFVKRFLKRFCEDSTYAALSEAVSSGETESIFREAHTLKGVSANLGLKPLFEKTCVLVEITRNGGNEGIREAFDEITSAYQEVIALIHQVE